jgi:membrane protein required for colicin V production
MVQGGHIPAQSLTSFDWFLVAMVAVSGLMAFRRGLVRMLFSLAGSIAGILVASWIYLRVGDWLHRWIGSVPAAQIVAFVAILMGVMLVFSIAAGLVRRTVQAVGLGFMDRVAGAGIGVVRGVLLGVAAMMALAAFAPGLGWAKGSVLAPYFLAGAHAVSFVVPHGFEQQMSAGAAHLLKNTPKVLNRDAEAQ